MHVCAFMHVCVRVSLCLCVYVCVGGCVNAAHRWSLPRLAPFHVGPGLADLEAEVIILLLVLVAAEAGAEGGASLLRLDPGHYASDKKTFSSC